MSLNSDQEKENESPEGPTVPDKAGSQLEGTRRKLPFYSISSPLNHLAALLVLGVSRMSECVLRQAAERWQKLAHGIEARVTTSILAKAALPGFSSPQRGRNSVAHGASRGIECLLEAEVKPELFSYMGGILTHLRAKPLLINGPRDHVHLLFTLPATLSLSDLMEKLKANSSKWLHQRWPRSRNFAWQGGYTAFSVSQSRVEAVKRYIANQEAHHRKATYQEEVATLLNKHRIEYEARFVFE